MLNIINHRILYTLAEAITERVFSYNHTEVVELQGFEPWLKEPKSLVLPLHHNSIYILHINNIYTDNDNIEGKDLQSQQRLS